jgi:hypothetical protein
MCSLRQAPLSAYGTFVVIVTSIALGCSHKGKQSSTTSAPAVTGSNLSSTGSGRSILTGQCTACHAQPSIGSYSASQWTQSIIPSMSAKAGLTSDQTQALQNYVLSVLNGSS